MQRHCALLLAPSGPVLRYASVQKLEHGVHGSLPGSAEKLPSVQGWQKALSPMTTIASPGGQRHAVVPFSSSSCSPPAWHSHCSADVACIGPALR
jgi:hypothetical protein